ncbi:MAG TPA: phosphatase PAP2 family protein [Magnetospirillum sp.]|jgi:membrane-associated phospholipid phosphatase|nr:phosphatase PAP2 family protein [Magnetospirillum sp.]
MSAWWTVVTDLGDTAVTLPLAALVLGFLLAAVWWRAALAWLAAIGGCGLALALLKIALQSCSRVLVTDIHSPSGHTAMSVAVYGGLAVVLGLPLGRTARVLLAIAAGLLALTVGASRIAVHAHTLPEVLIGGAIGLLAVAWLRPRLELPQRPLPLLWLFPAVLAVIAAMHGAHWQIEERIRLLAAALGHALPGCTAQAEQSSPPPNGAAMAHQKWKAPERRSPSGA